MSLNDKAVRLARAILPYPNEEALWEDTAMANVLVQTRFAHTGPKEFDFLQSAFWIHHFGGFSRKNLVATSEVLGLPIRRHGRWASNNELLVNLVEYFQKLVEDAVTPKYYISID